MVDGVLSAGTSFGGSVIAETGLGGSAIVGGVFSRATARTVFGSDLCTESKVTFHTLKRIATKIVMIAIIRIAHDEANDVPVTRVEAPFRSFAERLCLEGYGSDRQKEIFELLKRY